MTITRKSEEMASVGELLSQGSIPKSSEPLAISPPSPPSLEEAIQYLQNSGAPKWSILVLQMAQDKRHDLAPHTLRLWTEKLKSYRDQTICDALIAGRWPLFPSVDDVLVQIEHLQERRAQERGNEEWERYKADVELARKEGRLATDEDCAVMRGKLRELFGDPTIEKYAGKK